MVSNFKTKLVSKKTLSLSLVLFNFELVEPNEIIFRSGQYIAITLPDGKSLRSYSISSSELLKNNIELTINIYDVSLGGAGVNYLSNLQIGDEVMMKGPFGRLDLIDAKVMDGSCLIPDVKEIIWIGTGSGIAPLKSMLDYLNAKACEPECTDNNLKSIKNTLYIGARYSGDVCYFKEFKKVEEANPNFKFYYCLSKKDTPEDQGSCDIPDNYILRGHVTEHILNNEKDNMQKDKMHIFACGKNSTIQSIIHDLLDNGIQKVNVHLENFG